MNKLLKFWNQNNQKSMPFYLKMFRWPSAWFIPDVWCERGLSRGIISLYRINRLLSGLCCVQYRHYSSCTVHCTNCLCQAGTNLCTVQCSEHYLGRQAGSLWGRRSSALQLQTLQWITHYTLQTSNYSILYLFLLSSQEYSSSKENNIWYLIVSRWGKFKS